MPKCSQTCGKILSMVGLEPTTSRLGVDALPTEPRLQLIMKAMIAESARNAAMRLTANENVALSASAITA